MSSIFFRFFLLPFFNSRFGSVTRLSDSTLSLDCHRLAITPLLLWESILSTPDSLENPHERVHVLINAGTYTCAHAKKRLFTVLAGRAPRKAQRLSQPRDTSESKEVNVTQKPVETSRTLQEVLLARKMEGNKENGCARMANKASTTTGTVVVACNKSR